MRWLDRLLARRGGYDPSRIAALATVGQAVLLEGRVEALSLLRDPIGGEPAVLLDYDARTPGITQRYFGIHDARGGIAAREAVDFVLRDSSGAALIEVERGSDVEALHHRLQTDCGIGLEAKTWRIGPGDRVRVRGQVRALASDSSPHRREAWTVTVRAAELERI